VSERGEQLRFDGAADPPAKTWRGGYARLPGTGPSGESCGSCQHARRVQGGARYFWKCALTVRTAGPGSDIRKSAPACELWRPWER
jgi:hypothetical protein